MRTGCLRGRFDSPISIVSRFFALTGMSIVIPRFLSHSGPGHGREGNSMGYNNFFLYKGTTVSLKSRICFCLPSLLTSL
jgi:hypothetical protein